jgi:hypothetical protein
MKKMAVNEPILRLLVSVYNQSIQTYYHFPEVILCGRLRLEPEDFEHLLANDFIIPFSADSFGRNYRLSKKGEAFLFETSFRRRHKHLSFMQPAQRQLPFAEIGSC